MAKNKLYTKTLEWINAQVDDIHRQSIVIGDKILKEENPEILELLDQKLIFLEKQLSTLNSKFQYEKQNNK